MTRLSCNLNRIALLRNSRPVGIPNLMRFAEICVEAGAHGLTVHPRPDGRHILPDDVADLAAFLRDNDAVEFNIEGNPTEEFLKLVESARPDQCTLVPDSPEQATSDHGWDLPRDAKALAPKIQRLHDAGARVSLFIDHDALEAFAVAGQIGTDRVELYTGPFAHDFAAGAGETSLNAYRQAADAALAAGLGLNAGHDLNLDNLRPYLDQLPETLEVSIGHALAADALELGMAEATRRYLALL